MKRRRAQKIIALALSLSLCTMSGAEALRIMPWGDSITGMEGMYRYPLWQLLKADSECPPFRFVGIEEDDLEDVATEFANDRYHSGFAMETIDDQLGHIEDFVPLNPAIALLMIGTNDLPKENASGAPARLANLIDKAYASMPDITLIVGSIIPRRDFTSQVESYNQQVRQLVEQLRAGGKRIVFADINAGLSAAQHTDDGVHPNAEGAALIAQSWFSVLKQTMRQTTAAQAPALNPTARTGHNRVRLLIGTNAHRAAGLPLFDLQGRRLSTTITAAQPRAFGAALLLPGAGHN
jgi:hypothetical protein